MYLLKKVFQLRDKTSSDTEKPFLDHLEDLRIVVTRVVVTLLISTVLCFVYREHLMAVLRRPVDAVWLSSQQARMPQQIESEDWEEAKTLADTARDLPLEERRDLFTAVDHPVQEQLARLVPYYRAALLVPEPRRSTYVAGLGGADPPAAESAEEASLSSEDLTLLTQLLDEERQPSATSGQGGDLRMMSALNPTEGFMLSMKLAFFAGIVISFPLLLYFILLFILPGLKNEEKRVLWPSLIVAFGLFLGGVCFAYFLVLPRALEFFFEFSQGMGISNDWRIGFYISFATQFTLLFGLAFELPVVVMAIVKLGLLSYETMRSTRAYAILAIFIAAAIITPTPDAFTLLLMATPMYILYEACILMAWGIARRERRKEEAEEHERMQRLLSAHAETSASPADSEETTEQPLDGETPDSAENYGIEDNDEEGADEMTESHSPETPESNRDDEEDPPHSTQ